MILADRRRGGYSAVVGDEVGGLKERGCCKVQPKENNTRELNFVRQKIR